jgi:hypothetical protein
LKRRDNAAIARLRATGDDVIAVRRKLFAMQSETTKSRTPDSKRIAAPRLATERRNSHRLARRLFERGGERRHVKEKTIERKEGEEGVAEVGVAYAVTQGGSAEEGRTEEVDLQKNRELELKRNAGP